MPQEIWRDTEYPGYQVSNLGRVYSVPRKRVRGRFLSKNDNGNGYMSVMFCVDGMPKRLYVHRLVAKAFLPNPDNKTEVNHKDGNKKNNRVENLEWVTRSENAIHLRDVLGYKPVPPTEEIKEKIRVTVKKLWASGMYANAKKVEYTPEYRQKLRMAQLNSKAKKRGSRHPFAKPIICLETGEYFECAKAVPGDRGTIRAAIKLGRAYKGKHYKYVEKKER